MTEGKQRRRRLRARPRDPAEAVASESILRVAIACTALVAVASALLLGGAYPRMALLCALLAPIPLLLGGKGVSVPTSGWILVTLGAYCALQATPLPHNWVAALSPEAARIWERAIPGYSPGWISLSLDPKTSLLEAAKWSLYAVVLTASAWVASRKGTLPGLAIIFGSATAVLLTWMVHGLLEAESLYGIYKPRFGGSGTPSPLLNSNSLAGYLMFGGFAGVALSVKREMGGGRWAVAAGSTCLFIGVLMTGSTGGVAACLGGLLAFLVAGYARWRRSPVRLGVPLSIAAMSIVGGLSILPDKEWRALSSISEKWRVLEWSQALIGDFRWFGVGRGAFETVFPAYRQGTLKGLPNRVVFTHAENFIVQWISDWGLPVALSALLALVVTFVRAIRQQRLSLSSLAALIGMAALLTHNLVDLGLELPAVGIAFAIGVGTILGNSTVVGGGTNRPYLTSKVLLGLAGLFVSLGALADPRPVWEERDDAYVRVERVRRDVPQEGELFVQEFRPTLLGRPAEPYFPLIAAEAVQKSGGNALPWIGRALERDPSLGAAYVVLARELKRRGARSQALDALRHAIYWDGAQLRRSVMIARSLSSDIAELVRVAPEDSSGEQVLLLLASSGDESFREEMLRIARSRYPESVAVLAAQGGLLIAAVSERPEACEGRVPSCLGRLRELAIQIERLSPKSHHALEFSAVVTGRERGPRAGAEMLFTGCPEVDLPKRCWKRALRMASAAGDVELVQEVGKAYVSQACETPRECVRIAVELGDIMMRMNKAALAVAHYRRAAEIEPSLQIWNKLARASEEAGLKSQARAAQRRAERLSLGDGSGAALKK